MSSNFRLFFSNHSNAFGHFDLILTLDNRLPKQFPRRLFSQWAKVAPPQGCVLACDLVLPTPPSGADPPLDALRTTVTDFRTIALRCAARIFDYREVGKIDPTPPQPPFFLDDYPPPLRRFLHYPSSLYFGLSFIPRSGFCHNQDTISQLKTYLKDRTTVALRFSVMLSRNVNVLPLTVKIVSKTREGFNGRVSIRRKGGRAPFVAVPIGQLSVCSLG